MENKSVFVLEVFQFDWKNKPVISQFLICDTKETVSKLLDEVMKEYEGKVTTKEIIEDTCEVWRGHIPETPDVQNEHDFFVGWFEKHVNNMTDIEELLKIAESNIDTNIK